jgi:hypothetical protein
MKSKVLKVSLLLSLMALLAVSCSNDQDDNSGNNFKITVSLNNVNATDDFVSVAVAGQNASGNVYPMWKVNSQEKPATQTVSLGDTDFTGSTTTYIIETVNPIDVMVVGIQLINYGNDMTGSLKIERNGNTVVNEIISLVGDNKDFTEDYSF